MNRAVLIAALVSAATIAQAQSSAPEVGFSSIPFQFFPPGARSLAMGATFIGVADDATAAASNPAGLIILTKPEVSAHGRYSGFSKTTSGGFSAPATSAESLSYGSLVVPAKPFALSAYYQEVSRIDLTRSFNGEVLFPDVPRPISFQSSSRVEMLLKDVGLSGALRIGKRISLGTTVARRTMRLTYVNANTITGDRSFSDSAKAAASDTATVFSVGALVNPNGYFSAGFVYKHGGRFEIPYVVNYGGSPQGPVSCPRTGVCPAGAISIPDTWGVGFGVRPSDKWLLSADASLLRYSQFGAAIFRSIPFDIYPIPSPTNALPPTRFKDVIQIDVGVERILAGNPTVGLRGGFYRRPNFNKGGSIDAGASFATLGLGLVFGDRGQLDLAGSVSGQAGEGLASLVVRF